jgi:serine/threonine-protein kinase
MPLELVQFRTCGYCNGTHPVTLGFCPVFGLAEPSEASADVLGVEVKHDTVPFVPADSDSESEEFATHLFRRRSGVGFDTEDKSIVGRHVGEEYVVQSVLGRGGMGTVYHAHSTRLERSVALKVIRREYMARPTAARRFEREAAALSAVRHPNIRDIYATGQLPDGNPYLVMEMLHGETLADRIARAGPLPRMLSIDVIIQVLSALAVAHARGFIHRDLKPDNIFLVERPGLTPSAKLLDFGLAKMIEEESMDRITLTGVVVGTPSFMAPEQIVDPQLVDHRVDLWAVGVTFYQALTGRLPFVARNRTVLVKRILNQCPWPVRNVDASIPRVLDDIVLKALARNRDDRFASAGEFMSALLRVRRTLLRGGRTRDLSRASDSAIPDLSFDTADDLRLPAFDLATAADADPPTPT